MKVDLAVIGGGPGGYVAAIRAAQLGMKVVCIDQRPTLGGTCLNVGCIPSKALLHASHQLAMLSHQAPNYGITCTNPKVDFGKMQSYKDGVVKGLVDGVAGLVKKHKITWLVGKAQLVDSHTIDVEGQERVEATSIILATGSAPISLPFLPIDEKQIVTSTGALALKKIPKRMLVVGAGVIGVELASVYQRLGTEVLVVEMLDTICPAMDPAVSKGLLQALKKQGIAFRLGVKVTGAKRDSKGVTVMFQDKDKTDEWTADVVLVAIGRKPNSAGFNVATDAKGFVTVNGSFQTSIPSIYAIGDLVDGPMLAHKASEEGVAVAELLAGQVPHINYMTIPNVVYTHPEAAAVGFTEPEAQQAGLHAFSGTFPMRANARARCVDDTDGFVKIVGDKASGRLLGVHILSANASEMIGEAVIALENHCTVADLARACHAHPTLSESIKEACLLALGRPVHL